MSRRLPVPSVLCLSQLAALLLLVPVAAATGALDTPRSYLVPGIVAGAVGVTSLGMFFRALAIGTMGVVAPVAALGVAVPIIVGLIRGEQPATLQAAGIVVAAVGVVLASGPELNGGGRGGVAPLLLSLASATGFGTVLVLVARGSQGPAGAVVMTLLTMRVTGVLLLGAVLLVAVARKGRALGVETGDLLLLFVLGLTDVIANGAYAQSSRGGLISVSAVLASLYPVVTALLAYRIHGERLRRVQLAGVGITLVGIALLAGG